jgi:hypothetical protein
LNERSKTDERTISSPVGAMNDKKLYSWFLGPKAENADILKN